MSEHMVPRGWRWRAAFCVSYLLGLIVLFTLLAGRQGTVEHPLRVLRANAARHADIWCTGGFLEEVE